MVPTKLGRYMGIYQDTIFHKVGIVVTSYVASTLVQIFPTLSDLDGLVFMQYVLSTK